MRINHEGAYAASPDEVFSILTDPDFVAHTVVAMSVAGHSYHVTNTGRRTVVTSRRTLSTAGMPDIAKKVAGPVLTVDEEQTWAPPSRRGEREAGLWLRIEGVPVSLKGTILLAPSTTGALQVVRADLRASVPLVGSAIERAAAPAIIAGIEAEADLAREWLAR